MRLHLFRIAFFALCMVAPVTAGHSDRLTARIFGDVIGGDSVGKDSSKAGAAGDTLWDVFPILMYDTDIGIGFGA